MSAIRNFLPEPRMENNVTDVTYNVGDSAFLPCRFPHFSRHQEVWKNQEHFISNNVFRKNLRMFLNHYFLLTFCWVQCLLVLNKVNISLHVRSVAVTPVGKLTKISEILFFQFYYLLRAFFILKFYFLDASFKKIIYNENISNIISF